jgi:hypothetical protein
VVIGEWTVTGDEGRQLVPRGGTADLVKQVLAENGWQWLARHRGGAAALFLAGLAALLLGRVDSAAWRIGAAVCGLLFVIFAVALAGTSAATSRAGSAVLEYAAPVVPEDGAITVEIGNVPQWVARTGFGVWIPFARTVGGAARFL